MGFGLMFIGYIIAFAGSVVPQISALTFILGSGIILLSLKKLIYENKLFIEALVFAFLLEVSSIISLGIELFFVPNTVSVVFGYIANELIDLVQGDVTAVVAYAICGEQ